MPALFHLNSNSCFLGRFLSRTQGKSGKTFVSKTSKNKKTQEVFNGNDLRPPLCLSLEKVGKSFSSDGRKKQIEPLFQEVSLTIKAGEILGIMGHSGVGKTTLGRIIAGLEKHFSGKVLFQDKDVSRLPNQEYRQYRRRVQMIFQDPEGSFNPQKTLRRSLLDVLKLIQCPSERWVEVLNRSLFEVGLNHDVLERYPYQLSGGMNQRAALARVLLLEPELIILDEPTSALDVTIQAQILTLLKRLKDDRKLSYILISHNNQVIGSMSDRTGVLKNGRLTIR